MSDQSESNDKVVRFPGRLRDDTGDIEGLKRVRVGGRPPDVTDDWKDGVDRQLAQLHSDVRALVAALIVGFLILGGAGWTVYTSLSGQLTDLRLADEKAAGADAERSATINGKLDVISERLPPKQ